MADTFLSLFDALGDAVRQDDPGAFRRCSGVLWPQAQQARPDELTAALERLAPVLPGCGGFFAKAAVLAGALVEFGGSPLPLRETLPKRAALAMRMQARFPEAWDRATGGRPLPDRDGGSAAMSETLRGLTKGARRAGLSEQECAVLTMSWFDTEDWLRAMITVLARREFRAAMGHRDEVRAAAAAIARDSQNAYWVHGLALVLDDEPLLVLDPASGRGFGLTMSGVGDNCQLHTLLADRLIGPGLFKGERPLDDWVAAATTGAPGRPGGSGAPIRRRFRLFDGHGAYVYPEGRPADIEPLEGMRVLVLHPPRGDFGWVNGRTYEHMEPSFTLDRELAPGEAGAWLARVAPARETDGMAGNPVSV